MKSFKVRFHLAKGKNFQKWQITNPCGNIAYFDPAEVELVLSDCVLKNHKKVAQSIFNGANKTVCAWVLCNEVIIRSSIKSIPFGVDPDMQVSYNPRVVPNWMFENAPVDNQKFNQLISFNRRLYVNKIV